MDWDDLRLFLHVARAGRITGAAARLGLDHSTVSRRLSRLEAAVGTALFSRAGRRLKINAAGESLLSLASRMEAVLIRDIGAVAGTAEAVTGTVRIGAPEGLGAGYLGARLDRLCAGHPGLDLELVALPQSYSLASREVDIAVTLDRPKAGSVATRRLTGYRLGLFAAPAYAARHGLPETPAELARHRLAGYIPTLLHTAELDYLDATGVTLRPQLKSTSIIAQRAIVETGQAIGILPFFLVRPEAGLVPLLAGTFTLKRSYWLSVHDDLRPLARIRVALDALAALVRDDQDLFNAPPGAPAP
ncbi:LysR family transcriptional regulator [Ensifer soli]|uniref:LysR family transcriptional regulator n=1 Tax=Ciceribacter sp. sgz301302 TaxID=3342379 RepID=UPI0035B817DF